MLIVAFYIFFEWISYEGNFFCQVKGGNASFCFCFLCTLWMHASLKHIVLDVLSTISIQCLKNIMVYNELLFSTKYRVNKMHDFSGYIFNILLEKDKVVVIEYMENCTVTSCYRYNVLVILPAQLIPYKYQKKKFTLYWWSLYDANLHTNLF